MILCIFNRIPAKYFCSKRLSFHVYPEAAGRKFFEGNCDKRMSC